MWIVKIGGSWVENSKLPILVNLLQKFIDQKIVLVVGGGVFADLVRYIYNKNKMSEHTGHILAMKATEIFAYYLRSLNKNIILTSKTTGFLNKNLNLWLPTMRLSYEPKFEKSWESTSDSIATWLYSHTKSNGLIFIKSLDFLKRNNTTLCELQKNKILDLNVGKYLNKKKNLKIVGPEIIELLQEFSDWKLIVSELKEVEI